MVTIRILAERRKELSVPHVTGKPLRTVLAEAGIDEAKYMAVIVEGLLVDLDEPVADGATVSLIPPMYGG